MDFDDLLRTIPESEATPYLYYVLAWPWTRLFGFGEVGLRSLSALAGSRNRPRGVRRRDGIGLAPDGARRRGARERSSFPRLVLAGGPCVRPLRAPRRRRPALLRTGSARGRALGVRGLGRRLLARPCDALLRGLSDRPGGRVAPPSLPGTTGRAARDRAPLRRPPRPPATRARPTGSG